MILFFKAERANLNFIDIVQSDDGTLMHILKLNVSTIFTSNIIVILTTVDVSFLTNEDIQHSCMKNKYEQVNLYICSNALDIKRLKSYKSDLMFRLISEGKYHIYSLSYSFQSFLHLYNSFPDSRFNDIL